MATSNEQSCCITSNVTTYIRPTGTYKLFYCTNATPNNYPSEDYTSQQLQRMTSTSEEEETQNNSKNEW